MNDNEIINQLEELVCDRESFLEDDMYHDEIYLKDIEALKYAIDVIKSCIDLKNKLTQEGGINKIWLK